MKKSLSLFVAIQMIMLIFATAYAEEDFSLRNGVRFGDTKAQVRAKETIPINEKRSSDKIIRTQGGMVAGFNGVEICYKFTADDKLNEVIWNMPLASNSGESNSVYEKLQKALKSKYGEPLGYTNGDCYIVTSGALESAAALTALMKSINAISSIRDYEEWDYEYQPGEHVKIEIVQLYSKGIGSNPDLHSIDIGYKYFTDEDLAAAMQKKQEESQKIINDL